MTLDHPDEIGSLAVANSCGGGSFSLGSFARHPSLATRHCSHERLFYPFGEMWTGADLYSLGMHQTFGKLPDYDNDSGSDLYNTLNRHYTPMGRWLSPDPLLPFNLEKDKFVAWISDPQHWNKYAYVRNNPTTLADASGLTETIYYWLSSSLTEEQTESFRQHKTEILDAIADKLKEAGIKDVVFKEGKDLTKAQVNSILKDRPKGVAFLNFVNKSYGGLTAPSDMLGSTGRWAQSAVFMGNLESDDASTFAFRIGEVASHELGHGMGFKPTFGLFSRDLMEEGQTAPHTWWNPFTWGTRHFDMSIPQNRRAVDEINKLPEYQPR
jgi:RHS repeat-associated protein